jgi:uncharacterized cupin superfamily protein
MGKIFVEKPDEGKLKSLGVGTWPIWKKGVSSFGWSYDDMETCYILEGRAKVKADGGDVVEFGVGDLVTFPKGLRCTWNIQQAVKKHYRIG